MVDFTELGEINQILSALISLAGDREVSSVTLSANPVLSQLKLKDAYQLLCKDHFQTNESVLTINTILPRRTCMKCKACYRGEESILCPKCHSNNSTERPMPRLFIATFAVRTSSGLPS